MPESSSSTPPQDRQISDHGSSGRIVQAEEAIVSERFGQWLAKQEQLGREFTPEQIEWLTMIKHHIATSAAITIEDFSRRDGFAR